MTLNPTRADIKLSPFESNTPEWEPGLSLLPPKTKGTISISLKFPTKKYCELGKELTAWI